MAYTTRNLIVGAAAVYLTTADSTAGALAALPAKVAGTRFTVTLDASPNWTHVGYTTDGLEFSYEPDYTPIEVDQSLDAAKLFKTAQTASVNTTFAEATLRNLQITWGQQSATLASTASDATLGISAGALGDEPTERSLVAVGIAPRAVAATARERIYYARRVLSVEASSHALNRAESTNYPVSFRLLPDPAAAAGQEYGFVRDVDL
jgi:hypothetical protein